MSCALLDDEAKAFVPCFLFISDVATIKRKVGDCLTDGSCISLHNSSHIFFVLIMYDTMYSLSLLLISAIYCHKAYVMKKICNNVFY